MAGKEMMTFWDHADELRGVVLRMVVAVVAAAVALFCFMPSIFDSVVMAPCRGDFPLYGFMDRCLELAGIDGGEQPGAADWGLTLINTQLSSQLFVHISISCQMALVVTFPLLIYMLWRFVSPGLYESEKRGSGWLFAAGNMLFYAGLAVGYFIIFPLTLRFLSGYQLSPDIENTITLDSYIDNFAGILLVMGLTFEVPLVAWLLGRMGLLNRSFFSRWRRHAIVVLVVAAAVITPTSDPLTLTAVFIPLYLLWEGSAMVVPKEERKVAIFNDISQ